MKILLQFDENEANHLSTLRENQTMQIDQGGLTARFERKGVQLHAKISRSGNPQAAVRLNFGMAILANEVVETEQALPAFLKGE